MSRVGAAAVYIGLLEDPVQRDRRRQMSRTDRVLDGLTPHSLRSLFVVGLIVLVYAAVLGDWSGVWVYFATLLVVMAAAGVLRSARRRRRSS